MLVLTRKVNETIVINDNIRITIVGHRNNQVRIGVEAPREVVVLRDELRHQAHPRPALPSTTRDYAIP